MDTTPEPENKVNAWLDSAELEPKLRGMAKKLQKGTYGLCRMQTTELVNATWTKVKKSTGKRNGEQRKDDKEWFFKLIKRVMAHIRIDFIRKVMLEYFGVPRPTSAPEPPNTDAPPTHHKAQVFPLCPDLEVEDHQAGPPGTSREK